MANRPKLEVKANVPVTGQLEYVDHAPTRKPGTYEDQVRLTVLPDGGTSSILYLPLGVKQMLFEHGITRELEPTADGPYQMTNRMRAVTITKTESDRGNGFVWDVRWADGSMPAEKPVAAAAPAAPNGNGTKPEPAPVPGTPPTTEEGRKETLAAVLRLREESMIAAMIAADALRAAGVEQVDQTALARIHNQLCMNMRDAGLDRRMYRGLNGHFAKVLQAAAARQDGAE